MRDDPFDDELAELRIEPTDDESRTNLDERVSDLGGTVERELQFGGVVVSIPESDVASLCELDGIERIETVDTLGY
ncbi:hypothetical protein C453_14918 [Haloferax elongans ATCC BAA-1513]|uniref:Putative peptidase inhibitor domain-containing protein n=2 Tax=Haloferax elongans TaxID=403191 RepID=M0HF71_HALEO|nr:hypothetical protein C453_14918 [Haloferax elongans ATCC BAA-1513]